VVEAQEQEERLSLALTAAMCQDWMHEVLTDEHRNAGSGEAAAWKGVKERSFTHLDEQATTWATNHSGDELACRCEQDRGQTVTAGPWLGLLWANSGAMPNK
jgi:hypothetical protein